MTEDEYKKALAEINLLRAEEEETRQRFDASVLEVEAYEEEHYPIPEEGNDWR